MPEQIFYKFCFVQQLIWKQVSFKSEASFIQTNQAFQSELKLDIPEELIE